MDSLSIGLKGSTMGKIKNLMIMVEQTAGDMIVDMDSDICDRIEEIKDDYRNQFEYMIRDMADMEGWTEEDLDIVLEMSLEDIFDEAMYADSEYA